MYLLVGDIDLPSFYDFIIGFWNCSDRYFLFSFHSDLIQFDTAE
jgi:hypothetical protein